MKKYHTRAWGLSCSWRNSWAGGPEGPETEGLDLEKDAVPSCGTPETWRRWKHHQLSSTPHGTAFPHLQVAFRTDRAEELSKCGQAKILRLQISPVH